MAQSKLYRGWVKKPICALSYYSVKVGSKTVKTYFGRERIEDEYRDPTTPEIIQRHMECLCRQEEKYKSKFDELEIYRNLITKNM